MSGERQETKKPTCVGFFVEQNLLITLQVRRLEQQQAQLRQQVLKQAQLQQQVPGQVPELQQQVPEPGQSAHRVPSAAPARRPSRGNP